MSRVRAVRVLVGGASYQRSRRGRRHRPVAAGGADRQPHRRGDRRDAALRHRRDNARRAPVAGRHRRADPARRRGPDPSRAGHRRARLRGRAGVSSSTGRCCRLRVSATPAQALSGQAVPADVCTGNPVSLAAGAHRLQLAGDRTTAPLSLTAVTPGFAGPTPTGTSPAAAGTPSFAPDRAPAGRATVLGWGRTDRRVGRRGRARVAAGRARERERRLAGHLRRASPRRDDRRRLAAGLRAPAARRRDRPPAVRAAARLPRSACSSALLGLLLLLVAGRRPPPAAPPDPPRWATAGCRAARSSPVWLVAGVRAARPARRAGDGGRRADRVRAAARGAAAWLLGPALLVVIGALAAVFPPTSAHSVSDRGGRSARAPGWRSCSRP